MAKAFENRLTETNTWTYSATGNSRTVLPASATLNLGPQGELPSCPSASTIELTRRVHDAADIFSETMEHKSPHPYSPGQNHAGPSSSGITLILPSLKMIKQLKSKKGKTLEDAGVKKAPRPIKLKPLKDVLSMLINKVKK